MIHLFTLNIQQAIVNVQLFCVCAASGGFSRSGGKGGPFLPHPDKQKHSNITMAKYNTRPFLILFIISIK
jgi:hypothetical protein